MISLIKELAACVDRFRDDVVREGHKAGLIGTAFLHAVISFIPFWVLGFLGELLVWFFSWPWIIVNIAATIGTILGVGFYVNRELNPKTGQFWQYYYIGPEEKILDSILDVTFPVLLHTGLMLLTWL